MNARPEACFSEVRMAIATLLANRVTGASICPSEVARLVAAGRRQDGRDDGWRSEMPAVHSAVDRLVAEGAVGLSWKGRPLATRAGPYRIQFQGGASGNP